MKMKPVLALLFAASLTFAQTPPPAAPVGTIPAAAPDPARLQQSLDRATRTLQDWPALGRYRADNEKTAAPAPGEERVVFMGDSITDGWGKRYGKPFFEGKPYINRGIGGQTTPQMVIRFRPDVIALNPKVVVILAGTNDIAGNTGPSTLDMIKDNLATMTELAQLHGIKVVLSSVMPVCDYIRTQTVQRPNEKIIELNQWMKSFAESHKAVYLDYFTPMLDDKNVLKQEITFDGLHPNDAGYAIMMPLAQKAIDEALAMK